MLIKSFESFRPRAVQREDGRWVIGYGHTASAREGLTVGEQDAELLLQYDLIPVAKALNEQVESELNQHQFDALASFAVSVGVDRFLASDVLNRINAGQSGEAADALMGWPAPVAADAPLRRRAAERALFVADPAAPVLLADLLAAPLPPAATPDATPVTQPVDDTPAPDASELAAPTADAPALSRAEAVASLLGEAAG
ncbi:lysozyme, partial [Brevundimonas sp. FT23042]|uniref:lysozyme n=1 Tax=Brevundimonas sp. FT23042 TaxID=3393749 RepID=UPI003B5896AE